jgi:hypothetical protein
MIEGAGFMKMDSRRLVTILLSALVGVLLASRSAFSPSFRPYLVPVFSVLVLGTFAVLYGLPKRVVMVMALAFCGALLVTQTSWASTVPTGVWAIVLLVLCMYPFMLARRNRP